MSNIKISTRDLKFLPSISELRSICQSIAILDAILEPDWEFRYYSFNSKWNENEEMASMRDGSGDSYFILFNPNGTIIKGFAHESPMGQYCKESGKLWPGVIDQVPPEFSDFLTEPAFLIEETSFCIWRKNSDNSWNIGNIVFPIGNDPDGSEGLLFILDGNPHTYHRWAEKYYQRHINFDVIKAIYQHTPLLIDLCVELNPNINVEELENDIIEIGYPYTSTQ